MKDEFLGGVGSPWKRIPQVVRRSKGRTYAAVAYIGAGAARLLPLRKNDLLVVDASTGSVKSGRTDPKELLKFVRREVRVYSREGLHAKVVACENVAIVGSANASSNSEQVLNEAVVLTSSRAAIKSARDYVRSLCVYELGPKELAALSRLFVPPRKPKGPARRGSGNKHRVQVVQLEDLNEEFDAAKEATFQAGRVEARRRIRNKRTHEEQYFEWNGDASRYKAGDLLIQVVESLRGAMRVEPVGKVLSKRLHNPRGKKRVCFVYLEIPRRRAMPLSRLIQRIGRGGKKGLATNGVLRGPIKDRILAAMLD